MDLTGLPLYLEFENLGKSRIQPRDKPRIWEILKKTWNFEQKFSKNFVTNKNFSYKKTYLK